MKKTIDFNPVYITCLTCDLCYDDRGQPTYCQKGWPVDPRRILMNMEKAANCDAWFPKSIGRQYCGSEYSSGGERHYEKDSMA
jgi:hypothetical protein